MSSVSGDPRARMLDRKQVAENLGVSISFVIACQNATQPKAGVRPMPGWKQIGKKHVISEANLITWINNAPNK